MGDGGGGAEPCSYFEFPYAARVLLAKWRGDDGDEDDEGMQEWLLPLELASSMRSDGTGYGRLLLKVMRTGAARAFAAHPEFEHAYSEEGCAAMRKFLLQPHVGLGVRTYRQDGAEFAHSDEWPSPRPTLITGMDEWRLVIGIIRPNRLLYARSTAAERFLRRSVGDAGHAVRGDGAAVENIVARKATPGFDEQLASGTPEGGPLTMQILEAVRGARAYGAGARAAQRSFVLTAGEVLVRVASDLVKQEALSVRAVVYVAEARAIRLAGPVDIAEANVRIRGVVLVRLAEWEHAVCPSTLERHGGGQTGLRAVVLAEERHTGTPVMLLGAVRVTDGVDADTLGTSEHTLAFRAKDGMLTAGVREAGHSSSKAVLDVSLGARRWWVLPYASPAPVPVDLHAVLPGAHPRINLFTEILRHVPPQAAAQLARVSRDTRTEVGSAVWRGAVEGAEAHLRGLSLATRVPRTAARVLALVGRAPELHGGADIDPEAPPVLMHPRPPRNRDNSIMTAGDVLTEDPLAWYASFNNVARPAPEFGHRRLDWALVASRAHPLIRAGCVLALCTDALATQESRSRPRMESGSVRGRTVHAAAVVQQAFEVLLPVGGGGVDPAAPSDQEEFGVMRMYAVRASPVRPSDLSAVGEVAADTFDGTCAGGWSLLMFCKQRIGRSSGVGVRQAQICAAGGMDIEYAMHDPQQCLDLSSHVRRAMASAAAAPEPFEFTIDEPSWLDGNDMDRFTLAPSRAGGHPFTARANFSAHLARAEWWVIPPAPAPAPSTTTTAAVGKKRDRGDDDDVRAFMDAKRTRLEPLIPRKLDWVAGAVKGGFGQRLEHLMHELRREGMRPDAGAMGAAVDFLTAVESQDVLGADAIARRAASAMMRVVRRVGNLDAFYGTFYATPRHALSLDPEGAVHPYAAFTDAALRARPAMRAFPPGHVVVGAIRKVRDVRPAYVSEDGTTVYGAPAKSGIATRFAVVLPPRMITLVPLTRPAADAPFTEAPHSDIGDDHTASVNRKMGEHITGTANFAAGWSLRAVHAAANGREFDQYLIAPEGRDEQPIRVNAFAVFVRASNNPGTASHRVRVVPAMLGPGREAVWADGTYEAPHHLERVATLVAMFGGAEYAALDEFQRPRASMWAPFRGAHAQPDADGRDTAIYLDFDIQAALGAAPIDGVAGRIALRLTLASPSVDDITVFPTANYPQ